MPIAVKHTIYRHDANPRCKGHRRGYVAVFWPAAENTSHRRIKNEAVLGRALLRDLLPTTAVAHLQPETFVAWPTASSC